MNEELVNELITRLDSAAAKLSEGAAAGWEILVYQQQISGAGWLVGGLLFLALSFIAYKGFTSGLETCRTYNQHAVNTSRYVVPSLLFSLSLPFFFNGVARLLNPGYYAIMELLGRF